jgi:hypothetical protein
MVVPYTNIKLPQLTDIVATGVVLNKCGPFPIQIDDLLTLTSTGSFNGKAFAIENERTSKYSQATDLVQSTDEDTSRE